MKKQNNYWAKRLARVQHELADKSIQETEKQLKKYYSNTMKTVLADFEAVFDKLLATVKEGNQPTQADLYNLDRYWQMQAQLREELQKLGERQTVLMSKKFEETWFDIYNSVALKSGTQFSTIDTATVQQMINSVWCADGKTWSERVWQNTEELAQTLNDELINCVVTGKDTRVLKNLLTERFNVSYNRADSLVQTEIAHIQIEASARRYEEYGLNEYEFFAETDKKTCPICGKLDGKKFTLAEKQIGVNAPPLHPRCRCDILPVLRKDLADKIVINKKP
jgi:SPP1 gp7 family putative phage head morphogenesis protein